MKDRIPTLVPMKGHSERVPGKNLRPLEDRPLFQYVLSALASARHVGKIYVDTDSDEIARAVTESFDAEIIKRPKHLCGDLVPMTKIIAHDLAIIGGEWFLQTHSTNPLLRSHTIDRAIEELRSRPEHDSLFTVTALHTRLYWPDGRAVNHDPDILLRTQDLPPVYEENSNLYLFRRETIETFGRRIGSKPLLFPMDREEAVDIDTELDFQFAGLLLRKRRQESELRCEC